VRLELDVEEFPNHLVMTAAGPYSLANVRDLLHQVKRECTSRGKREILLDLTQMEGPIPVLDMLMLGHYCARIWQPGVRGAVVSQRGGLNQFFENVAQNRGGQVAVVPSRRSGMAWLQVERPSAYVAAHECRP